LRRLSSNQIRGIGRQMRQAPTPVYEIASLAAQPERPHQARPSRTDPAEGQSTFVAYCRFAGLDHELFAGLTSHARCTGAAAQSLACWARRSCGLFGRSSGGRINRVNADEKCTDAAPLERQGPLVLSLRDFTLGGVDRLACLGRIATTTYVKWRSCLRCRCSACAY
jgi:hypothetical protein